MDIQSVLMPATTLAVGIIGWWVRGLRSDSKETKDMVRESDKKIDALRNELHAEIQQYTHKDTCLAHREGIYAQLKSIHSEQSKTLGQIVNNTAIMHALHESMTDAERKYHVSRCQFREDMEGLG